MPFMRRYETYIAMMVTVVVPPYEGKGPFPCLSQRRKPGGADVSLDRKTACATFEIKVLEME